MVTAALLSWIIQVFAEGTASLKTLDQEYVRTFKEQRQVCQKGMWVEQNGWGEKGSCRPSVSFQPPSIKFYSLWRKSHGRPMILHHQVIYGKFLQVSNLTNCSLMQPLLINTDWKTTGQDLQCFSHAQLLPCCGGSVCACRSPSAVYGDR